jgi:HAD superfamily hydrolase (TIGR01509 family)
VHRVRNRHGNYRAIVFDLGGVLVELGPLTEILGDEPLPADEFWARWLQSPVVRDFERGRCTPGEFGERIVEELGLSFGGPEMIRRFADWPKGLFGGAKQLIADLPSELEVGVLSNTNALHWSGQRQHLDIRALFTRTYLSYQLDMVKPDAEIFAHVVADLACPPAQILYFDDNELNVDAAIACGLDAALVRHPGDCRAALVERGILL